MSSSVYIPTPEGNAIEFPLTDLGRSDGWTIANVLRDCTAEPDLWIRIAMAYFEADNLYAFEQLLGNFTNDKDDYTYSDSRYKAGRVRAFNTLAAYHLRKASLSESRLDQEKAYTDATDLLNQSGNLDALATMTWVGKGVNMMLQGDFEQAQQAFQNALLSDPMKDNVLVRLSLASLHVQKRAYAEAAKHYRAALLSNPSLPGYVRLGLGLCYYYMNDFEKARATFQRVLDLSKSETNQENFNVHALLGLATLELNRWREKANQVEINARKTATPSVALSPEIQSAMKDLEKDASVTRAHEFLQSAYQLDPKNVHANLLLSTHAFHCGEFDRARHFAVRADKFLSASSQPKEVRTEVNKETVTTVEMRGLATREMKGLAAYHIARVDHAVGDFNAAMTRYEEANRFLPTHPPICLGYAQMLLACRQETEKAITVLEQVLAGANSRAANGLATPDAKAMAAAASNNFEVLRILGSLYAQPPSASATMRKQQQQGAGAAAENGKTGRGKGDDVSLISLPNYEKSFTYLKKCTELHPTSLELLVEYAEVAARIHEYQEAYMSYKLVLKGLTKLSSIENLSSELLNNFAVVCVELGKLNEAKEYFEWSKRNKSSSEAATAAAVAAAGAASSSSSQIPKDKFTTQFNIGILYEKSGKQQEAMQMMEEILREEPKYVDAAIYKARILAKGGKWDEAELALSQFTRKPGEKEGEGGKVVLQQAQCELGNWHLAQGSTELATKVFSELLTKRDNRDEYAKLALGNLAMTKLVRRIRAITLQHPGYPLDHPTIQQKFLQAKIDWKEVSAFFENVLRANPNNKYAAHGLGCLLASQGKTLEAKEVFIQMKDINNLSTNEKSTSNQAAGEEEEFLDVWVNLGHIYVVQSAFVSAIKMYQHVLRKLSKTSATASNMGLTQVQVLTYLARAYYLSDAFMDAKKTLMKAIQLAPGTMTLWYNLGLVSEAYAIDIFQKPPAARSFREVESAILELNSAFSIFTKLQSTKTSREEAAIHGDVADKAGRHAVFCRMSIQNGQPHLAFARQREDEQARLLEESKLAKAKLEAEREAAQLAAEQAAQAERERLEKEAQDKKQYLAEISTTWETVKSEETIKKEREAARAAMGGDDDDMPMPGMDSELQRRREKQLKKMAKKRSKREAGSGSEDEDEQERKKRRKEEKKKKGSGRSKYQTAEGSDAEPDHPSPAKREADADSEAELGGGGMDVDAEMAARRAKAAHLTSLVQTEQPTKEKRRLTKATADEEEEEAAGEQSMEVDDGEVAAAATTEDQGETGDVDIGVGGDAEDDEEGQQARKKSSKKRRQIEDDEEEDEPAGEAEAAAAAPSADAMTDE